MAATKKSSDDAIDRLKGVVNDILNERDQRAKEEKDPQARFDRVMGRLEKFLDGAESTGRERKAKTEPDENKDEGGGFLDVILGGK